DDRGAVDLGGQRLDPVRPARGAEDVEAGRGQVSGRGRPDAAARSGHDCRRLTHGAIVVADSAAMTPTSLTRVAGLLGGLCWVVRAVLDDGDGPESLINGLHYGGLALLVIALLGIG